MIHCSSTGLYTSLTMPVLQLLHLMKLLVLGEIITTWKQSFRRLHKEKFLPYLLFLLGLGSWLPWCIQLKLMGTTQHKGESAGKTIKKKALGNWRRKRTSWKINETSTRWDQYDQDGSMTGIGIYLSRIHTFTSQIFEFYFSNPTFIEA